MHIEPQQPDGEQPHQPHGEEPRQPHGDNNDQLPSQGVIHNSEEYTWTFKVTPSIKNGKKMCG